MISQVAYQVLNGFAGVTSRVSNAIYYAERPQEAIAIPRLPAIVIEHPDEQIENHLKGPINRTRGNLHINALATTYLGAKDVARQINAALNGYQGQPVTRLDDGTEITLKVAYILTTNETDLPTDHRDGQGRILTHGRLVIFRYSYQEL